MGIYHTIIWYIQQNIYMVVLWFVLLGQMSVPNSSLPGQNGRHFADKIFKCIFLNEKFRILFQISLKLVPKGLIDNMSALVQEMACCQTILTQFIDAYMWHQGKWVNGFVRSFCKYYSVLLHLHRGLNANELTLNIMGKLDHIYDIRTRTDHIKR